MRLAGIKGVEDEVEMVGRGQIITELVHLRKGSELLSFKPAFLEFCTDVPQKAVNSTDMEVS